MAKGETVERILAQVRAAAPELPESAIEKIARGIHADMGGQRVYVGKNPSQGKEWGLGDVIAAGVPFAQAWGMAGISMATAYRVRRRWMMR